MAAVTVGDLAALVQPDRVHRRLYTDPTIFDAEMIKIFGGTWCYLGHDSEIPEPGTFRRRQLGRRPLLFVRGSDGAVRALFNRCSHRATRLVQQDAGCVRRFTCPYHGWSFTTEGRLRTLPVPSSYPAGAAERFDLGQAQVDSYRGFWFATVAADPPPLAEHLGALRPWLDEHVDRHPGGKLRVLPTPVKFTFRGNWKLSWDNAADGVHATFAHRSYNLLGREADTATVLARNPATTPMVSRTLPGGHSVVDQRPGIPDGPWATMRPLPTSGELVAGLDDQGLADSAVLDLATGSMLNVNVFPNLIFVGNQLMVVEPLAVDLTRLSMYLVLAPGAPDEVNLLRLRVDEDFVSFGTPDDLEMFERVQEGLAVPEEEWVDVSRGAGAGDQQESPDVVRGDIATEAPIRGYLAEWLRLMTTQTRTVSRRAADGGCDMSGGSGNNGGSEKNKALVRAYHERLWRDGDQNAIADYWSPSAVVHLTGFDGQAIDTLKADVTRYWEAFTDVETEVEDLIAEADKVVLRWATTGTHVGQYGKVAATGRRITMRGVDVLRVEAGRFVECWSTWDGLDVYDQLGVLPELW